MNQRPPSTPPAGLRAAACFLAAALLAGCAGHATVTEQMMWSTCPVATLHGEASAFIVRSHDSAGDDVAVVFTSAHVLKTLGDGPLIVGLHHRVSGDVVQAEPLIIVPARGAAKQAFYVKHPMHDLAAFCIHLPEEAVKEVGLDSSLDERALAAVALHAGDEVSFLGYPDVFPGTRGGFALLRSGRVSSHPASGPMAQGRFLINADVYPGDSGAPVFLASRSTGRPHVVGVLTSRIGADRRSFSHLAMAVDAEAIRETLALLKKLPPIPASVVEKPGAPP